MKSESGLGSHMKEEHGVATVMVPESVHHLHRALHAAGVSPLDVHDHDHEAEELDRLYGRPAK